MAILNKAQLNTLIQTFTTGGENTAEQLRAYLTQILDSSLLQITNYVILNMVENWTESNIDENTRYLANQGVTIQLPAATTAMVGRTATLLTTTTDTLALLPSAGDTINGNTTISQASQVILLCTAENEWQTAILPIINVLALANLGKGFAVDKSDPDKPIISVSYQAATDSGTNADVPDSWTQLCSVTLTTEVGGLYMLTATATYSINSTSNAAMFRTTGDLVSQEYMMESKDSDDVRPISISIPYVATGVSTTINIEAAKEKPQSALDISYSSITLHRIG